MEGKYPLVSYLEKILKVLQFLSQTLLLGEVVLIVCVIAGSETRTFLIYPITLLP